MELLKKFSNGFWNEDVWLPPNVTWKDIEPGSRDDVTYADYRHLLWPIPMSFIIIALRFVVETYWIMPVDDRLE